jgi:transketolase
VQWAVEGAKGKPGVRVVSLPCFERFDRQSAEYRESVLPAACTKRIAIEAGVSGLWWKYVGTQGQIIGIDRFGISAPGNTVFKNSASPPRPWRRRWVDCCVQQLIETAVPYAVIVCTTPLRP